MIIHLSGKTRKGQNRINQFGAAWIVTRRVDHSPLFASRPAMLIRAVGDDPDRPRSLRWIASEQDADFTIVLKEKAGEISF